jgi:hypothetical protein
MLLNINIKYKLSVAAICTKEVQHDHKVDIMFAIVPWCQHLHMQLFEVKRGIPRN